MASGLSGPPNKRFAQFPMDEIDAKQKDLENKNSVANEEKAVKCFKTYLATLGLEDLDFFKYTEAELDHYLKLWYFNAHTKKGEMYKYGTLNTLRYGLNRALKKYGHNFDITNPASISFTKSIKAFEDACEELKKEGKAFVQSYKEIPKTRKYNILLLHMCQIISKYEEIN